MVVSITETHMIFIFGLRATPDMTRRFEITWFMGAIHKYGHLLSEVLVVLGTTLVVQPLGSRKYRAGRPRDADGARHRRRQVLRERTNSSSS
jgi:hypothetical protein